MEQKWKITEITIMNKYIQQFLEDNDLQAGEKFYILNSNKKKLYDKTFYINKDFEKPEDILKCDGGTNSYPYTLLKLLVGNLLVVGFVVLVLGH